MRAAAKAVVCSAGWHVCCETPSDTCCEAVVQFPSLGSDFCWLSNSGVCVCECVDIYISAGWRIFFGLFSAELGVARPGAEVSIVCLFTWREKERLVDGDCDRI